MQKIKNYTNLMIGLFLASFAFNIFLAPNNLASGGVSGLALIIHKILNFNESLFIFIINLMLVLISYLLLGKEKTKKTILGSLLFPIFITLTNYLTPLIKTEELELILIAVLGGILSGTGYGLIFKSGYTSGGTDILNQIVEKYAHVPISTSIILVDGCITILGGIVFGLPTMVYAFLALILISVFSNKKILGIGKNKTLYIYTTKYNEIKYYLHFDLKVDSTDFDCIGGYSKEPRKVILTIIKTRDYYRAKETISLIDENVFIIASNSYEIKNANLRLQSE